MEQKYSYSRTDNALTISGSTGKVKTLWRKKGGILEYKSLIMTERARARGVFFVYIREKRKKRKIERRKRVTRMVGSSLTLL